MTDEHVEIEDVTTALYKISQGDGDLSAAAIAEACYQAMMEISLLRDRVVTLEMQVELVSAVNEQMRGELEARHD